MYYLYLVTGANLHSMVFNFPIYEITKLELICLQSDEWKEKNLSVEEVEIENKYVDIFL